MVFHVGIAFVKCERVNNSISPECQLYRAPHALGTMRNLEVVSPKERIINCILKFYLWLLGLGPLFILNHHFPPGNHCLRIAELGCPSFPPAKKASGMTDRSHVEKKKRKEKKNSELDSLEPSMGFPWLPFL